jgi:bifunctional non-homologous end joining protein LigD
VDDGGLFVIAEHHGRRPYWDLWLERDGMLVPWRLPRGVPDDPAANHLAVRMAERPLEEEVSPEGEFGGGAVWDYGRYETLKWSPREVKVVLHGRRVEGGHVLFQVRGAQWMIHRERQPLPAGIRPMLAVTGTMPRDRRDWGLEMKWDGVRALAFVEGGRVRLTSRTERDITVAYPELRGLGAAMARSQLLLDGEVVVFGRENWPRFEAIQPRMHVSSAAQAALLAREIPVTYLVFDLLHLDGRPLFDLGYAERRARLEELGLAGPFWQVPPWFPGEDFAAVRDVSASGGMEGVVAKRLDSRYVPGARTDVWRKIKNVRRQEAVIAGYKPGQGNRAGQVGSLLIGVHDLSGGLIYAGHVGTGFTAETLRMLGDKLRPLRRPDSPFDGPVPPEHARPAVWVEPKLVIDVVFDTWTKAGRMRAPVYKGLRDDIDPAEVIREP